MKILNMQNSNISKRQSGFTLLEVLVALVLGVAIITATINMYFQYRDGFRLSSNQLQMQTNAKSAFELISQSLRSSGSMGCKTALELMKDAGRNKRVSSDGTNFGNVLIAFNNPETAFADFRPGFEVQGYDYQGTGFVPSPSVEFKFVALGNYNSDSDVLTVAGAVGDVFHVRQRQPILAVDGSFQFDMTNVGRIRIKQNQYGMLSNCNSAKIFKITSSDADIQAGNIGWGGGSGPDDNVTGQCDQNCLLKNGDREFRRTAVTTYFVGMSPLNDPNGVPTLYMDVDGISSPLVEGVEEIQIEYGLSADPVRRNIADRYVRADVIDAESDFTANPPDNKWEEVVAVRIGIILRSAEEVFDTPPVPAPEIRLNCVNYTQLPVKSDRYMRTAFCAEVALRNHLTGSRVGTKKDSI